MKQKNEKSKKEKKKKEEGMCGLLRPVMNESGSQPAAIISYEEAMEHPKLRKDITNRWRVLGLTNGLAPNSKTEKMVIEGYERMAIYLLSDPEYRNNVNTWLEGFVFPLTRILYTGEKITGKRLHSIVKADVLYKLLNETTVGEIENVIKDNTPKSYYEKRGKFIFRLMEHEGMTNKCFTEITEDDFKLSEEKKKLLTALFEDNIRHLDFECELMVVLSFFLVHTINKKRKNSE
jgi:hypothetical protein